MRRSTYTSYKTTSQLGMLKLFSLFFVFGAFSYIIYYAAVNQDSLSESSEIELISPIAGAVKERAENPGGMNIPNQDKQVFDLLETSAAQEVAMKKEDLCAGEGGAILCNGKVERIQPLSEKPQAQTIASLVEASAEESVTAQAPVVEKTFVATAAPVQAKVEPAVTVTPIAKTAATFTPTEVQKMQIAKAEAKLKTIEPAAGPSNKEIKQQINKMASEASFGIQLASYGSKAGADRGVNIYRKKLGSLISNLTYKTESVDVKGRTFYRVQMFGLASTTDAKSLCGKIKAKKENCLPITR